MNGAHAHPIYQELTQAADADGEAGDVKWNFEKFLVSPDGKVVARFRPPVSPEDPLADRGDRGEPPRLIPPSRFGVAEGTVWRSGATPNRKVSVRVGNGGGGAGRL